MSPRNAAAAPTRWPFGLRTGAAVMAVVLLAAVLTVASAPTARAEDRPLRSTPLITWNMQGATESDPDTNKWSNFVRTHARAAQIVMLQEAGPRPAGSALREDDLIRTTVHDGVTQTHIVQHYTWNVGNNESPDLRAVYFLPTQNGRGGRVNLAIVVEGAPDEVNVVENPVTAGRTALGVRFGAHWYFTVHGLSGGGGDSAVLLNAIDDAVTRWENERGVQYRWTVGGDFNVDPLDLEARQDFPVAYPVNTPRGVATHNGGRRLDYFVTDDVEAVRGAAAVGDARLALFDNNVPPSDHRPVAVGQLRAAAPNLPDSVRMMATGDSITDGYGSGNASGYRDEVQYDVGNITPAKLGWSLLGAGLLWSAIAKRDLVGERCSGVGIPDRDHEGWPGYTIDEIGREAQDAVPGMRPNIVTLMAGTNDMVRNVDVGNAPGRLSGLIDQIFAGSPGVAIVVATLPPSTDGAVQARIDAYNTAIRGMVNGRTARGDHVLLVEMDGVTTGDLADVVHPNDNGYRKIADVFLAGVQTVLSAGWVGEPGPMTMTSRCSERAGYQPLGVIAAGLPGNPDVARSLKFADLDGDGKDDYIWLSKTGAATVWLNRGGDGNGGGGWLYRAEFAVGAGLGPDRVHFADMDGDGKDDYIVIRENNAIDVYYNRGGDTTDASGWHAGWEAHLNHGSGTEVHIGKIRFADLDGDRRADYIRLVDFNRIVDVFYNRGGDTPGHNGWQPGGRTLTNLPSRTNQQIEFADLDADGLADYIALDPDGVPTAWLNTGGTVWTDRGRIATGTGGIVALPDLDGDGRADWVQIARNGALTAWLNKGGD